MTYYSWIAHNLYLVNDLYVIIYWPALTLHELWSSISEQPRDPYQPMITVFQFQSKSIHGKNPVSANKKHFVKFSQRDGQPHTQTDWQTDTLTYVQHGLKRTMHYLDMSSTSESTGICQHKRWQERVGLSQGLNHSYITGWILCWMWRAPIGGKKYFISHLRWWISQRPVN